MKRDSYKFVELTWLSVMLGATWASGQAGSTSSRLTGTVRDMQNAVVLGASVEVKNDLTDAIFDATTNEVVSWTVPSLQNGTYTVRVRAPGFKTWVTTGVKLDAASATTVNVDLEVGWIHEEVVVSGASEAFFRSALVHLTRRAKPRFAYASATRGLIAIALQNLQQRPPGHS